MSNIVHETTSFKSSVSSHSSDELGRDDPIQEMLREMSEHHQKILARHFRGDQDEMSRHYQQILDTECTEDNVFPVAQYRPPPQPEGQLVEDRDNFEINVNMNGYDPSEVCVKTMDNVIVVEGQHEEKRNGQNYVSRQFSRRYTLPPSVNPESITSKLGSDGVLSISAPKHHMIEGAKSHYNPQEVRRDSNVSSTSSVQETRMGNNLYNTETKTDTKVTTRKESTISTEENHFNGDTSVVKHEDGTDPIRDMLAKMNTKHNNILDHHFSGNTDQMIEHYQKVVNKEFAEDPFIPIYARTLSRQHSSEQPQQQQREPSIIDQDHEYEITVNVSGYQPEEINVKTVDHSLTVECKHEESGGYVTRQLTRKYQLPRSVDPLKITSNLSSDGLLVIRAPKKVQAIDLTERMVPMSISGNQKSPRKDSQYKSEIHVSCK